MSRSIPIFPREQVVIKPGEKKLILIETPFEEEISGMAIVKIVGSRTEDADDVEVEVYKE